MSTITTSWQKSIIIIKIEIREIIEINNNTFYKVYYIINFSIFFPFFFFKSIILKLMLMQLINLMKERLKHWIHIKGSNTEYTSKSISVSRLLSGSVPTRDKPRNWDNPREVTKIHFGSREITRTATDIQNRELRRALITSF